MKPKWDLQLHYLLLSEEHYTFGDSRLSIIDMDIAIDLCIRKYLRAKTKLERPPFDALLEDTSTGQLLTAAKLISEGKTLISGFMASGGGATELYVRFLKMDSKRTWAAWWLPTNRNVLGRRQRSLPAGTTLSAEISRKALHRRSDL